MAYYLAIGNGGTDEEVLIGTPIADQSTNQPAIIKIRCSYGGSGNSSVYFLDAPSTISSNYYILTPTAITLAVNGSGLGVISLNHGVNYNDEHEYAIHYDGVDLWLEVDDVETDRVNGVNGEIFGFSKIHPDAITGSLNVYYIEYTRGSTLTHRWDANASGGTGLTLPDTVGGNDGALSSFDGITDSWWVFYNAPSTGVEVSVTESSSDFSESSATSFTAILSAQVTEVSASFTESSSADFVQVPAGKWYLKFDGVNDYVSLPSPFSLSSVGDYIELDVDIVDSEGFFFSDSLGNFGDVFSYVSDRYRLRIPNSGTVSEILAPTPTGRALIKLTLEAGGYQLNVNGADLGVMSQPSGLAPSIVGAWSTGSISTLNLYRLKVSSGGSLMRDYNPSSSGGTGSILPESENNQDGTLVNFPIDNSQWVAYQDYIDVTVTELVQDFSESSSLIITNNLVTLSVTETSQDFSESASANISGSLSAIITELSQSFTESSTAEISANISAAVTELAQDFNESAQVNLTSSFTVEVTETTSDFEEACYIQLPVQRLTPRKTISVSNRSGSTIRVRRRSSVIRVK